MIQFVIQKTTQYINTPKILAEISIGEGEIDLPQATLEGDNSRLPDMLSWTFVVLAGIAVIVIILAGIRYMTSEGEPQKLSQARNAIIYAIVGLVLASVAFSVVSIVSGRFCW